MAKKPNNIPDHVAIIMDGNRRWAARKGLGPIEGHKYAAEKAIEPIVENALKKGIKFLTFWAFSTENWRRDKKELEGLFKIFRKGLKQEIEKLDEKGVRLRVLGDINKFPKDIAQKVLEGAKRTADNKKITVSFALNYGGRPELLRAVKKMLAEEIPAKKLDEKKFSSYLDTAGMPDPDLIIRTGGEKRLSGLLPWQGVYAELYFTDTLWPDFTPAKFDQAIADYQKRTRRFGGGKFGAYKR
jgi:undecaprenyl diphosphate synthase